MPTVAKMSIKVELDAKSFNSGAASTQAGAKKTERAIHDLGDEAVDAKKDVASLSLTLNQAGGSLGKIVGLLGGLAIAKVAFDGVRAGIGVVGELNGELRENASALGLSTETLSGWSTAAATAGTTLSAVAGGSQALGETIRAAITEPGGEADLALQGLGLSAEALAGMSPEKQLAAAADGFAKTASGALKAADAEKVFGSNAGELTELLSGGSAALEQGAADADRFGLSLSSVGSDQIEAASQSLNDLWQVAAGVAMTVGAELAPYVQAATSYLVELAASSDLAGQAGSTASMILVEGARFLGDAWDAGSLVVANFTIGLAAVGTTVADVVLPPVELLLQAFDAVAGTNFAEDVSAKVIQLRNDLAVAGNEAIDWRKSITDRPETTGDQLANSIKAIGAAAEESAKSQGTLTKALEETADAGRNLNQAKINSYLGELQAEIDGFDASKADQAAAAVAKLGGSESEQAQAAGLAQYAEDLELAKKVMEDLETPTAKYEERLGELSRLLEQGVIDQDAFNGAAAKAAKDRDSANNVDPTRRATAVQAGSADALKAVRDYRARENGRTDGPQKQIKLQEESLRTQRQELAALQTLAAKEGITFEVVTL